jgi:hypothetical protein
MPQQNFAHNVINKLFNITEKTPLHRLAEHICEIIAYPIFTIHILKRLPEHIRKWVDLLLGSGRFVGTPGWHLGHGPG